MREGGGLGLFFLPKEAAPCLSGRYRCRYGDLGLSLSKGYAPDEGFCKREWKVFLSGH